MKNVLVVALATLIFAGVACAAVNPLSTVNGTQSKLAQASPSHCAGQAICKSDQAQLMASEGAPMPTCRPGHCAPSALPQIASEGAPMPTCRPGHCALPQMVNEGLSALPRLALEGSYREISMTL